MLQSCTIRCNPALFVKRLLTAVFFCITSPATYAQNVFPANGNVGIGTNSPTTPLDVVNNQNQPSLIKLTNTASGPLAMAGFQVVSEGGNGYFYRTCNNYTAAGHSNQLIIQDNSADFVFFGNDELVRLKNNTGNLGIGTPTPRSKVDIWDGMLSIMGWDVKHHRGRPWRNTRWRDTGDCGLAGM